MVTTPPQTPNFKFDQRNLPSNLQSKKAQDDFSGSVLKLLQNSASNVTKTSPLYGAVVGMLVLDGFTDSNAANFSNGFWGIRGEAAGFTTGINGTKRIANEDVYVEAGAIISRYAGHKGSLYFQELAEVSRKLIAQASSVPVDGPGFVGQVRVYDDGYTTTGPAGDTLDLPDLTGSAAAAPDDIRPDNIRAVAVVYAAYNLEQLRMFDVVDRITETWWNGQLPVGYDGGTRALDNYFWSSEFRLSPARHMQYGRVLGAPGGEVSTEVQPNTQFNDLFMRLIASLAEYDRQQRIGDIVGGQRTNALTLTGEAVRQAGRNLAANASLYGWGGTQFAARRLATQVETSLAILNAPDLQAAMGVDGPWKMIERVATEYWGGAPNIVKYRTLAQHGRDILNLLATYSTIWSGSTGRPLFNDPSTGNQSGVALTQLSQNFGMLAAVMAAPPAQRTQLLQQQSSSSSGSGSTTTAQTADIQDSDRDELMRDAGYIIAVQGIKDDTVSQLSEPAETQYAPSIPTITAAPTAAADGQAGIDQLRQMVTQGQVPSLDQLKSLVLPGMTNGQKG